MLPGAHARKSVLRCAALLPRLLLFACFLAPLAAEAGPADRSVRPLPGPKPVRVTASLNLVEVSGIRDREQELDVELYLYQSWEDRSLVRSSTASGLRTMSVGKHWIPNEEFIRTHAIKRESDGTFTVAPDGQVRYAQHVWVTLSADFDLRRFPFDEHVLPISLESFSYPAAELEFVATDRSVSSENLRVVEGWRLQEIRTRVERQLYPEENTRYSRFVAEIVVKRESGYYLWKIVLPLVLIIAMSWSVFWMDPRQLEAQMAVSVTSMLAVVAFNFAIADMLPKISYVTRMDVFIVLGYVFVFGAFVENLVTHVLCRKDRFQAADRVDQRCRLFFPAVFFVQLALFLVWP